MRSGLVVLAVVAILLGMLWGFQRRLIYLPYPGGQAPPASQMLPGAVEVTLETGDGLELGAWHLPAGGPVTVLVANGNAGHRGFRAPLARALAEEGLGVLLFDYRGFGGNAGSPSEPGLALDVRAARSYLVERAGLTEEHLLYFGESLGAAVVAELATEHPPAGMLLRSPFTDLASIGRRHYPFLPVGTLLRDRYPVAEHVSSVHVPVTVVLGTEDRIVPASESRELAAAVAGPVTLVEVQGADHNDRELLDGADLVQAVVDLARHVEASATGSETEGNRP